MATSFSNCSRAASRALRCWADAAFELLTERSVAARRESAAAMASIALVSTLRCASLTRGASLICAARFE